MALGNLRKTILGEQSRYFTHDSLGRLLYAKQPEQQARTAFSYTDSITGNTSWSVKYEYDDNGNITSTTNAEGVSLAGTYDNFNRLKLRNYSDSTPDVDFYYDGRGLGSIPNFSKGKTTKVTSSVSENRYTSFDNVGRLLTSEQRTPFSDTETIATATPRVSSYEYDAYGKLLTETYPSGRTVKMDYNQDGDVSSIWGTVGTQNRLYVNSISYNSSGAIERLRLGNGKWETTAYNNRLQVTEIGLGSSATDKSLLKLEYDYGTNTENNGSLRSQKISFSGLSQPFEQTYIYDDLNRLLSAEEKVNTSTTTWKQTFVYDRYGNRRFDAANTTTLAASNNITNPTIDTATNRFSSGQNYGYDKDGNLTVDAENRRFVYDAENHQTQLFASTNSSSTPDATYHYDGEGRRVKKISSTETVLFVYDGGGQLVAEYSTQLAETPQVSYLTSDHLGSPRVITNQIGAVTTRKDYMAFGEETYTAQRTSSLNYDNESETRKGYTGYEKDDESGLDFAQARYYNSKHGRFTSVDPLMASANVKNPQTFNRYSYVLNSPYKFTDPLGLISSSTGANGGSAWCSTCESRDENDNWTPDPVEASASDSNSNAAGASPANASTAAGEPPAQQAAPPVAPPPFAAEQNQDEKTTKKLYIFIGMELDDAIVGNNIPPDFSSLGGNVVIIPYTGLGTNKHAFLDALKDPNSLGVLYVGHSTGDLAGLQTNQNGGYQTDGNLSPEEVADIKTPIIGIFSCNGIGIASKFNTPNQIIAMDSGGNKQTSLLGLASAAYGAAQAILNGGSADGAVRNANLSFHPIVALGITNVKSPGMIFEKGDGDKVVKVK